MCEFTNEVQSRIFSVSRVKGLQMFSTNPFAIVLHVERYGVYYICIVMFKQ